MAAGLIYRQDWLSRLTADCNSGCTSRMGHNNEDPYQLCKSLHLKFHTYTLSFFLSCRPAEWKFWLCIWAEGAVACREYRLHAWWSTS